MARGSNSGRPWTDAEWETAQAMRSGTPRATHRQIADALCRTEQAVHARFSRPETNNHKRAHLDRIQDDPTPPSEALQERQARLAAHKRDLTGVLMGDPPRGFSEYDRRVAASFPPYRAMAGEVWT
jgi:hypothetical protein